jgi:hypothetical protein
MPDYNALIPEERQLFCKFVHDLRKANKFLTIKEAQRRAYQMVLVESMKEND